MTVTRLKKYAQLIAMAGINVQPGQEVLINADLDQPKFVEYLVEACYKAGASKVIVNWSHQPLTRLHVKHQSGDTLSRVENWEVARLQHQVDTMPAVIHLMSEDPDGLSGIDTEKYHRAMQARYQIIKPMRDAMENHQQWCIAAVPGAAWAKKVFPDLRKSAAIEKLWEAILTTSRVDEDPVRAWQIHNTNLHEKCDYLNSLGLRALRYKAGNGTDFRVGLIPDALFMGGAEKTLDGVIINPNIPSEEIYISPMRGVADGIVYSSRPLSYRGVMIEDFSIRFQEGRAVEVHAARNEELLRQIISMDEGAAYLGECALVPYDSPICRSGITFYNTLFDENAACHLALGRGFSNCLADYEKYSLAEAAKKGINDSMIHEDFMIGTKDLSIDGELADGKTVPIFRNGNWAF